MKGTLLVLLFLLVTGFASATLAPLTPEELSDRADTVVTGTAIESRLLLHRMPGTSFYYVRLKVKVEAIEKGRDRVRGAGFIEVRCWHDPEGDSTGAAGHDPIPADGARFRAWMTRHEDGFFEALEPNGFQLLDGSAPRSFPAITRRSFGTGQILGGIIGLLAVVAAAFLRLQGRGSRDQSWSSPEKENEE